MTDKKTQTEIRKELLQARHRAEEAQARNRVKERNARTRRLIQEGAVLESIFPGIPDNGAVADQTGIVKPFQKNLTLVDTSNFSSRRAHLLTT